MLSLAKLPCRPKFVRLAAKSWQTSVPRCLSIAPIWMISLPKTTQQHRSITNATKIDHVSALLDVPRVASKPGGWKPTLIHSSGGGSNLPSSRVEPGGEVPRHFHHNVWDYFMPLAGQGVVKTKTKAGDEMDYDLKPSEFSRRPAGRHTSRVQRVARRGVRLLIAQSPRHEYDFISAKDSEPRSRPFRPTIASQDEYFTNAKTCQED